MALPVEQRISISQGHYWQETLQYGADAIKKSGADYIELLANDANRKNKAAVKRILSDVGLPASSVCFEGFGFPDRDLSHPDLKIRAQGLDYLKSGTDLTAEAVDLNGFSSKVFVVVPTPIGERYDDATRELRWQYAVETLQKGGEYALKQGVTFAIEPLRGKRLGDQSESWLVNTVAQAERMAEEVGLPNVVPMIDDFHAREEERDENNEKRKVYEVIVEFPQIGHFHLAGLGGRGPVRDSDHELDHFSKDFAALNKIGYEGPIVGEMGLAPHLRDMEIEMTVVNLHKAAQRMQSA